MPKKFVASAMMVFAALLAGANAESFVLFDHCFQTAYKWQFWFEAESQGMNPDAPKNWESPVNYKDGTYSVWANVLEKEGSGHQGIMFAWMNKEGCFLQRLWSEVGFTQTGFAEVTGSVNSGRIQHTGECDPWSWTSAWDMPWTESESSSPPFTLRMLVTVFSQGADIDTVAARTAIAPTIEPDGGTFQELSVTVSLHTYSAMSVIRYTLDGSEPTEESPACTPEEYEPEVMSGAGNQGRNGQVINANVSEGEVELPGTCVLKARAFSPDLHPSAVAEASFTLPNGALSVREGWGKTACAQSPVLWRGVRNGAAAIMVTMDRPYEITVTDVNGRVVARKSGAGPMDFSFGSRQLGGGMFLLRVDDGATSWRRSFIVM